MPSRLRRRGIGEEDESAGGHRFIETLDGAAEGCRETVSWGGVPPMRKEGRETRRNIIGNSLQIFSANRFPPAAERQLNACIQTLRA